MLDIARNTNMYPMLANNALVMSIGAFAKPAPALHHNPVCISKPIVKAGSELSINASTEVIDVAGLLQKSQPLIQYVEISDSCGKLYCSNNGTIHASCWLKIVTIAKDCQSCNVLLMMTAGGIVLKTIRSITRGEPLLMWFAENILATLNMPYLTNLNIKGQNRYICHLCNNHFEYPNPLKIHLALKCNRLDGNYLWTLLAKEMDALLHSTNQAITPHLPTFQFQLTGSPRTSPILLTRTSPNLLTQESFALTEEISVINRGSTNSVSNTVDTFRNYSSTSSDQISPTSSTKTSQISPTSQTSYCSTSSSSTQISPTRKNLGQRHSAFKPYINQPSIFPSNILPSCEETMLISSYSTYSPAAIPMQTDQERAAHLETVVSNLGKSKQGHRCVYCGKVYSRKYGLKIHIRIHTGYKPLKCKHCLRPFGDPSNLNKHVRLHSEGETPYRCDLCGKILVRRRDLERHMKSRHQNSMEHHSDTSSDGAQ